jgi:hypothetical protein
MFGIGPPGQQMNRRVSKPPTGDRGRESRRCPARDCAARVMRNTAVNEPGIRAGDGLSKPRHHRLGRSDVWRHQGRVRRRRGFNLADAPFRFGFVE